MIPVLIALSTVAAAPLPTAAGAPLVLTCQAVATEPLTGSAVRGGARHKKHGGATAADDPGGDDAGSTGGGIDFVFEIGPDVARVRYPAAIVPTLHSGGGDGWWPVAHFTASDDGFTGTVVFNLVNRSHFTIDRRTGALEVRGLQANVSGHCVRLDPARHLF